MQSFPVRIWSDNELAVARTSRMLKSEWGCDADLWSQIAQLVEHVHIRVRILKVTSHVPFVALPEEEQWVLEGNALADTLAGLFWRGPPHPSPGHHCAH